MAVRFGFRGSLRSIGKRSHIFQGDGTTADFSSLRAAMVESQLRRRGIEDERVLAAMGAVPRESFVPSRWRHRAYADSALPIGSAQTISQPWVVAAICQALELGGDERLLEVGTGSGYSTCVLSQLVTVVLSIERHESLARGAEEALTALGVDNVEIVVGDGSRGQPDRAPFDAIAVHASAPAVPEALLSELAEGGRLVVPIATEAADMLTLFRRRGRSFETDVIGPCRFVPLIGEGGFSA